MVNARVARDRQAKAAAMRAAVRRAERRRTAVIVASAGLLAVLVLSAVAVVVAQEQRRQERTRIAAAAPIDGVQEFPDLSQDHVTEPVDYQQSPPVGGDHAPAWTNCGAYEAPVTDEQAVHSLEHGAVWITYRPDLPRIELDALSTLAGQDPYVLLSPYEGQSSHVVASAWGVQLAVDGPDDPRLQRFLDRYLQGSQTPEPGAPCSGGVAG